MREGYGFWVKVLVNTERAEEKNMNCLEVEADENLMEQ